MFVYFLISWYIIIMTKDFEIEVGEDNIVYFKFGPIGTKAQLYDLKEFLEDTKRVMARVHKRTAKKVLSIVDIRGIKKYHPEGFMILAKVMRSNSVHAKKTAIFGCSNKAIRIAQDVLLALSGHTHYKAFDTRREADNWLVSSKK